jgi:hypothetical protein
MACHPVSLWWQGKGGMGCVGVWSSWEKERECGKNQYFLYIKKASLPLLHIQGKKKNNVV